MVCQQERWAPKGVGLRGPTSIGEGSANKDTVPEGGGL